MLIYGTKTIDLKTIDLPVACTNCGHSQQRLHIFRNFLSLYFIPIIPLRKKGIVNCPACLNELKEKVFFKELAYKGLDLAQAKSHYKSFLNSTKTPLYMYVLPFLLLAFLVGCFATTFHESQQIKLSVKEYLKSPLGNVITVIKSKEGAYPYHISYIAEIYGETAVVFDWGYSYESKNDVERGVKLARKSIDKNDLKTDFSLPHFVPVEIVKEVGIVDIRTLNKPVDWKRFVPPEYFE